MALDGDLFDDDEMERISAALAGKVLRAIAIEKRPGLNDELVLMFDDGALRIRYSWLYDWLIDWTGDEVKHDKETD